MGALVNSVHALLLEREAAATRVQWPSPRYKDDPVLFCLDVLGFVPTAKQVEILLAIRDHERVAVHAGRKVGKSRILAAAALWWFCTHKDATTVIVAPCERQIVEITWYDLVGLFHASGRCLRCRLLDPEGPRPCVHSASVDGVLSASVRTGLRTGQRRIIGLAPRNSDNARGISGPHQLWLIDESSGVSREIMEAADGNRAAGAKLCVSGNPTSRATWFYDACTGGGYHTIHIPSTASPNYVFQRNIVPGLASTKWINEKKEDWGGEDDPRYQVEVMGQFPTREGLRLVGDDELSACFARHEALADKLDTVAGELYVGIDPAGGRGRDKSAIVVRRGSVVLETRVFNGATDQIMGELDVLLRRCRRYEREIVVVNFDASSTWGVDLHEALGKRRLGGDEHLRIVPCEIKGNKVTDPALRAARCARLVDAYYLNLSIRMRADAAIPYDETFRTEALFAEFREDQEDGTKFISKREYRKALGHSPDLLDATALAFWEGRVAPASAAAKEYRQEIALPPLRPCRDHPTCLRRSPPFNGAPTDRRFSTTT